MRFSPARRTPAVSRVLLACAGLTACAYVDPDPGWADREAQVADATAFTSSTHGLSGVDPPAPADRVEKGDRILYGIEFVKGDATRNWLVHVEVLDPEFGPRVTRDGRTRYMLQLAVSVRDEEGIEVGRDVVTVSRDDLVFGLYRACLGDEAPRSETHAGVFARIPPRVRAGLALRNMLRVMRKSDALFDILWEVIDKPSIFSVIFHLGVRVSVDYQFEKARERTPLVIAGREFPVYEFPAEMQLNGSPALRTKVVVTEPSSPLNLSAGILAIDAFQPSDPTARVSIRVLAARRSASSASMVDPRARR